MVLDNRVGDSLLDERTHDVSEYVGVLLDDRRKRNDVDNTRKLVARRVPQGEGQG